MQDLISVLLPILAVTAVVYLGFRFVFRPEPAERSARERLAAQQEPEPLVTDVPDTGAIEILPPAAEPATSSGEKAVPQPAAATQAPSAGPGPEAARQPAGKAPEPASPETGTASGEPGQESAGQMPEPAPRPEPQPSEAVMDSADAGQDSSDGAAMENAGIPAEPEPDLTVEDDRDRRSAEEPVTANTTDQKQDVTDSGRSVSSEPAVDADAPQRPLSFRERTAMRRAARRSEAEQQLNDGDSAESAPSDSGPVADPPAVSPSGTERDLSRKPTTDSDQATTESQTATGITPFDQLRDPVPGSRRAARLAARQRMAEHGSDRSAGGGVDEGGARPWRGARGRGRAPEADENAE